MKIGTKVYKIVGFELKEFFVIEVNKASYRIQSEESTTTYQVNRKDGFSKNSGNYLSRIVGLRELEEKTFNALVVTRKAIQDFRKEYLQGKGLEEYTEADLQRELYDYDAEQIEGEEL